MRRIVCVVAVADHNVIGVNNDLVVRSSVDLQHFKDTTSGGFLIMGRNTCESLPFKLPNRHSHVITNNTEYESDKCDSFGGLDLDEINKLADEFYQGKEGDIFLIGGASLIESMKSDIDEVIKTYFYAITVHRKLGDIVRLPKFKIAETLSEEFFQDSKAVFVPSGKQITGGVTGCIKHYTLR